MTNYHFVSFGDSIKFKNSLQRINQEALSFQLFKNIFIYTEHNLPKDYFTKHNINSRGFGYWSWKPYCILDTLNNIQENDIILYCDSGCHLNIKAKNRLIEYFQLVENNTLDNLSFQLYYPEHDYSKMDLLSLFPVDYHYSYQLHATSFIIKKTQKMIQLIQEWKSLADNIHLINDTLSILPNYPSFKDHRHDQSIFSLLRKKYGSIILPDETWPYNDSSDWNKILDYPIHAKRIRY